MDGVGSTNSYSLYRPSHFGNRGLIGRLDRPSREAESSREETGAVLITIGTGEAVLGRRSGRVRVEAIHGRRRAVDQGANEAIQTAEELVKGSVK